MPTHVAIIGAYGSAGVAVADDLAEDSDIRLTLIDDGDPGGGLCILRGCMPSKEVISAAEHRFAARRDDRLGGQAPLVDLDAVVQQKDEHVANFAGHRRAAVDRLAERSNVTFHNAQARFIDDHVLAVDDREIEPDYIVIATGSVVSLPELPGIEDVNLQTSADVLDATGFGDSGIVMGFGYIGLELVPYLAEAAGMDLTVVEHDAAPLDEADPSFGRRLLEYYRDEYEIEVRTNTHEQRIEETADGGVRLHFENGQTAEAEELFAFTGRRPALDRLNLDASALDPGGEWVADTMQAVDDDRVYVVGDANGREPILHVAKEQGAVAAANIRRAINDEPLQSYENIHHHVIFSGLGVLPYARVGHSAESADAAGLDFHVVTREAADDGVFATKDVPEGLARLIVDTDGTVRGYQGLHYHADVMAKTMQIVVETGMDVRDIPDRAYHPTTPEIIDGLVRSAAETVGIGGDA